MLWWESFARSGAHRSPQEAGQHNVLRKTHQRPHFEFNRFCNQWHDEEVLICNLDMTHRRYESLVCLSSKSEIFKKTLTEGRFIPPQKSSCVLKGSCRLTRSLLLVIKRVLILKRTGLSPIYRENLAWCRFEHELDLFPFRIYMEWSSRERNQCVSCCFFGSES